MSLAAGFRFRDYEILRMIGSGGMGEVYLAKENLIERFVAIKRLNPIFSRDEQFITRFRNEAQILATLSHPNIVSMISFIREGQECLMVLEYASGTTLRDLIHRTGPIPEERSIRIYNQIASALAYAHSKGVIHRDIKPSNIMVDVDNHDTVKVMDFGIARFANDTHLTKTGLVLGTVRYMSPEQVLTPRNVDLRSDIYSAGLVLYEMLSGRFPYEVDEQFDSEFMIQQLIVNHPIPDPRQAYAFISESTVACLMDMTRKKPEERPDTIPLLGRQELDTAPKQGTWLDSPQAISAESDNSKDRVMPQPARRKTWIVAMLILLCAGLVAVFASKKPKQTVPIEVFEVAEASPAPAEELPEPEILPAIAPQMRFISGGIITLNDQLMQLSDFQICTYEISREEYNRCMKIQPSVDQNLPVVSVSWMEAIEFCNRLSLTMGFEPCYSYSGYGTDVDNWPASRSEAGSHTSIKCNWNANGYRLPTETEWIYAANEAKDVINFSYSGSKDLDRVAWYSQNSGTLQNRGLKVPNQLGLYDMSGNACEWVWDISGNPPIDEEIVNYRGPSHGQLRIVKGGSVQDIEEWCNITKRGTFFPERVNASLGFRVARKG